MKRFFILLAVLSAAFVFSCRKNSGPSWDVQALAPLIKTSLSINNLVTNSSLITNPTDSTVTLVFNDSLYNFTLDSLLKIRDTTLSYQYPSFSGGTIPPGGALPLPASTSPTQYNTGAIQLSKAIVSSGKVTLSVSSYLNQPTDYTYSIPSATLGSNPLTLTVKVPAGSASNPATKDTVCDLSGYTIDLTGPGHNGTNQFLAQITGIVDPSGGTLVTQTQSNGITINVTFQDIVPYYGQGYFGQTNKTIGPQQSNLPLFGTVSSGSLDLKNVTATFTLENGFGVDARITIPQLTSINQRSGGITIPMTGNIINNTININRATQTYNPASPVVPSIQTYSLTPANSNILQWVDNLPTSIGYTIKLETDPLGNVSGNSDFAFMGQGIKGYLNVSVPLFIAANNLTLADTLPVNFASSSEAEQVKSGTFTLYASNLFPFSAGIQLYLLDNYMHITDSLCVTPQTISAGVPNISGYVAVPQNSILTIPVSPIQASKLFATKHIIVSARFNMGCTTCLPIQYSKIYNTYQLNIKLIGNLDYQVKG